MPTIRILIITRQRIRPAYDAEIGVIPGLRFLADTTILCCTKVSGTPLGRKALATGLQATCSSSVHEHRRSSSCFLTLCATKVVATLPAIDNYIVSKSSLFSTGCRSLSISLIAAVFAAVYLKIVVQSSGYLLATMSFSTSVLRTCLRCTLYSLLVPDSLENPCIPILTSSNACIHSLCRLE